MKKLSGILLLATAGLLASSVIAADLVEQPPAPPEPSAASVAPKPGPVPADQEKLRGIWGAIAYDEKKNEYGFFWGADKKDEAEKLATEHCENAGGETCAVVSVFRNHRHWTDDDKSGFPYWHCGAIATGTERPNGTRYWGASSAPERKDAEKVALDSCGGDEKECKIREWVCT